MRSLDAMTWQVTANPNVGAMPKKISEDVRVLGVIALV
jgi:hypothetical protein